MCYGCWQKFGAPNLVNDRVLSAVRLIARVYDHSMVGGNLHCQLDDWNLEDEHFGDFVVYHPADTSTEEETDERACFDLLKEMPLAERASALALYCGFTFAPATYNDLLLR